MSSRVDEPNKQKHQESRTKYAVVVHQQPLVTIKDLNKVCLFNVQQTQSMRHGCVTSPDLGLQKFQYQGIGGPIWSAPYVPQLASGWARLRRLQSQGRQD